MKEIKLTQGKVAIVDDEDFGFLNRFKWFAGKIFYKGVHTGEYVAMRKATGGSKSINQLMHRVICGVSDESVLVDHKDRNRLNNQRSNLRVADYRQNSCNRKSANGSSSKYLGVCWDKYYGKWKATIRQEKKTKTLGFFINEDEAAIAYNNAAMRIHGEFANLNIIQSQSST